jgi:hypothetical protein
MVKLKFAMTIGMAVVAASLFASAPARAQDDGSGAQQQSQSAMDDLMNAVQDGQEAVAAPSDEKAKEESNETFDTPHDSDGD